MIAKGVRFNAEKRTSNELFKYINIFKQSGNFILRKYLNSYSHVVIVEIKLNSKQILRIVIINSQKEHIELYF